MSLNPIASDGRARLRKEQAAEAAALRGVHRAQEIRARHGERLALAEAELTKALVELVRVSGAYRAARLTNESLKAVRQVARDAGLTRSQIG